MTFAGLVLTISLMAGAQQQPPLLTPLEPPPPPPPPATWPSSVALIAEINAVRTDPQGYAQYLRAYRNQFEGGVINRPGRGPILALEGVESVDEAIVFLESQAPRELLQHNPSLDRSAADHVADQGPGGLTGHNGTDGSDAPSRARRYGEYMIIGENISFGEPTARDVVIQFLVDAGVPDRAHRHNLFAEYLGAGAACGAHATYGQMCVVDLAF